MSVTQKVHTIVLLLPAMEPGGRKGWKAFRAFNCTALALEEILGDSYYVVRVEVYPRARKTLLYLGVL